MRCRADLHLYHLCSILWLGDPIPDHTPVLRFARICISNRGSTLWTAPALPTVCSSPPTQRDLYQRWSLRAQSKVPKYTPGKFKQIRVKRLKRRTLGHRDGLLPKVTQQSPKALPYSTYR